MAWYNNWGTQYDPSWLSDRNADARPHSWYQRPPVQAPWHKSERQSVVTDKVCPNCMMPATSKFHKWCNQCGTRYPGFQQVSPRTNTRSFSDKALPDNVSLIMESQVKTQKTVDLGMSPSWFKEMWMDKNSKYFKLFDNDKPPPWLLELRESSHDYLPEHMLGKPKVAVTPTPPPPPIRPNRDAPDHLNSNELDFKNPPSWFNTLWHQPKSRIFEEFTSFLDVDNPPKWLLDLWTIYGSQTPVHLTKDSLKSLVIMPGAQSQAQPQMSPDQPPDGFPCAENNFMYDFSLYNRRNQPSSAYVWDGFEKFEKQLPTDAILAHPYIAKFIEESKSKVDEIDDVVKELRSIRAGLGMNTARAIQAKKKIEASPKWLNRNIQVPSKLPTPPAHPNTLASVIQVLEAIKSSPALNQTAAATLTDAILKITASAATNGGNLQATFNASPQVASPMRKKPKTSFDDSENDMDLDPSDLFHDIDSNGAPFGATSASSGDPTPHLSAPPLKKKKKKRGH